MIKLSLCRVTRNTTWLFAIFHFTLCLGAAEPDLHAIEADGEVSEVYFYGPAVWLSTPGERLGRFPHLKKITLACGRIGIEEMKYLATVRSLEHIGTGELPEEAVMFEPGSLNELRAMNWLKGLEIYQNPLPELEWQFLANLEMLRTLHLDCVAGLRYVEGSGNLEYLYLFRDVNQDAVEPLPTVIATLPNLKHLSAYSRSVQPLPLTEDSLALLSRLPNLRSLRLEGVSQHGVSVISGLVNVEELTLSSVAKGADITLLRGLKNLREIALDVESLGPMDLAFLSELTELKALSLRCRGPEYHAIQNIPFERMQNLESISFWTTRVEEDVLARIAKLPKLQDLSVESLGEGVEKIKADLLRNGVDLRVNHQRFRGEQPSE